MGDSQQVDWPEDDPFVRLFILSRRDWDRLLDELRCRSEPAAVAWFHDTCEARVLALTRRLAETGLTVPGYIELCEKAWEGQLEAIAYDERLQADHETAEERTSSHRPGWRQDLRGILADSMRDAVVNLHLRGWDDEEIAAGLNLPEDWPKKIVSRVRLRPKARAVVRAHLAGGSMTTISKATDVSATTVIRILCQIGDVPRGSKERVDAAARARTIVKLRDRGLSYKEIAARVGCSMDVVKNVLRRDRRHRYRGRPRGAAE